MLIGELAVVGLSLLMGTIVVLAVVLPLLARIGIGLSVYLVWLRLILRHVLNDLKCINNATNKQFHLRANRSCGISPDVLPPKRKQIVVVA